MIVLYLLWRGVREPAYFKGLDERLGFSPLTLDATVPGGVWLHAVSVGEVLTAVELLKTLRTRLIGRPLYVSVTTLAGRQLAEQKLRGIADAVFYAPLDYAGIVRRVLRRLRPRLVVVMETEIWPNLFREAKRFGCGLVVVNGRISDRAFPRYRQWRWFFEPVLRHADRILVQNAVAETRYSALGAPVDRIEVTGNLKYDFATGGTQAPAEVRALVEAAAPEAVWIAASTMPPAESGDPDEDDAVITAHQKIAASHPRTLLILVPRRPERFAEAARKLEAAGIPFLRRSALKAGDKLEPPGVLLLDTVGELSSLFPLATVVFMGGTLARRGGHNILEPAFFARPVIVGPHMENFPDIAAEFRAAGAVESIADGSGLAAAVVRLIEDPARATELGDKAKALAEGKRGVTALAAARLLDAYSQGVPCQRHSLLSRLTLGPLRYLWLGGMAIDRWGKQRQRARLKAKTISVGGIAMGGVGKTPVVAWLAERLHARGLKVAVLTRGYKRRSPESRLILEPGEACSTSRTGDEAQLLLRRGHAWLGIGADRWRNGAEIERRHAPDLFLLDDGFQHWKLERDLDLVLLDSFDPLARNAVFPLGRLREPLEGLSRASAFLITRSHSPDRWKGLEAILHKHRPDAPVFYSSVRELDWREVGGQRTHGAASLPSRRVAAFCGIGNPSSFWSSLHELGIKPENRWIFGDHTHYRPQQMQRMAREAQALGVELLLTTEKDAVNLPDDAAELVAPLRIFWLRMEVEIDREDELLDWLLYTVGVSTQ